MPSRRSVVVLEPIDLSERLAGLELHPGQVARLAGISTAQLDYWTARAEIPTSGKKQRLYDLEALETVLLVKQARDKGLGLRAAIEAARRFRERG